MPISESAQDNVALNFCEERLIKTLASLSKNMSNELMLLLLRLLFSEPMSVSQLAGLCGSSRASVSGMLGKLCDKGLIDWEQQGKCHLYRPTARGIASARLLCRFACVLGGIDESIMVRLRPSK